MVARDDKNVEMNDLLLEKIQLWDSYLRSQGVSPHTVRAYRHDVRQFMEDLKLTTLESMEKCSFTSLQPWLLKNRHPRTTARALAALRHLVHYLGLFFLITAYKVQDQNQEQLTAMTDSLLKSILLFLLLHQFLFPSSINPILSSRLQG